MERLKSRPDVAVFVDFENVYVSVREKFDAQPNFELIMDRCEDYGRIVLARAYADWYRYPRVTSALFANGVEPMYVPTYHYDREAGRTGRPIKNSVDIHLCIDAMRTLYTQTHIDKFVLVTGDRDFIPLVNAIRQHGKDVIIIGIGGAASAHLAQSSDEFLFYEQIADLKTPQQQRQEQSVRQEQPRQEQPRQERRERDRSERPEREKADGNGRTETSRVETNGRAESKRERATAEQAPAPVSAPAEEQREIVPERTFFNTLVDAINLARQRGFVSNLGSLKVLMRELDSAFHESKAKDSSGRPFSKFKDFVKEAERQGKVQIFTNGTVTEVFLPGEDPLRVSQFAEDLASQQVERELESELAEQEALFAPPIDIVQPDIEEQVPVDVQNEIEDVAVEQPSLPGIPVEEPVVAEIAAVPVVEVEPQRDEPQSQARTFGEREWQIFRASMSQFVDPVRFADIFSALRGLRNQELFDLTNNELKELVKQAINRGILQRTGRGARAYYRLSTQYRVSVDDARIDTQETVDIGSESSASATNDAEPMNASVETAAGLADSAGLAPSERRRRGRAYDLIAAAAAAEANATEDEPVSTPEGALGNGQQLQDTVADQMATQQADEPAPAKPRRNRRKKAAPSEANQVEAAVVEPPTAQAADANEQGTTDNDSGKAGSANGAKKRRTRRKKSATGADEGGAEGATE